MRRAHLSYETDPREGTTHIVFFLLAIVCAAPSEVGEGIVCHFTEDGGRASRGYCECELRYIALTHQKIRLEPCT